jgi:spoIIIJ-associated protein
VQWVVTTGRTVADAKARALDALGIDDADLEYEVLAEPSTSLFGLRTRVARVRARVRPTRPRPKVDRRTRRTGRSGEKRRRKGRGGSGSGPAGAPGSTDDREPVEDRDSVEDPVPTADRQEAGAAAEPDPSPERTPSEPVQPSRSGTRGAPPMSDIPLDTQEPTALQFVRGLVDAFGADADVAAHHDEDDDAIEIRVEGDDLGLLVGPRGATLSAIAELTRTAVAQQHSGRLEGRLRVDVAGYRARRKEALVRFAGQIADQVLDSGEAVALEPMSPPDRKIVHDAVNDIDGVHTTSRGEDRRRHVVIEPD